MKQLLKALLIVTALGGIGLQAMEKIEWFEGKEYITSIKSDAESVDDVVVVVHYPGKKAVSQLDYPPALQAERDLFGGGSYQIIGGSGDVSFLEKPIHIGDRKDEHKPVVSIIVKPMPKVYTYDFDSIIKVDERNQSGKWLLYIDANGAASFQGRP